MKRLGVSLLLAVLLAAPVSGDTPASPLEAAIQTAAHAGRWKDVLGLLVTLQKADANRYVDGRFDYLTAHALAETGRGDEAAPRFERYITSGELFEVPARLAAARLRFARGDGQVAMSFLLPLLSRGGAVGQRAQRVALDALETSLDAPALERLASAHPPMASRERRRLAALRAEAEDLAGQTAKAAALRREILQEARRDDAAAIVLARELKGKTPDRLSDDLLLLLADTARSQRDLELAERLVSERYGRFGKAALRTPEGWGVRFELFRLKASRGKFTEARDGFAAILAERPRATLKPRSRSDQSPGTAAFFGRVAFNHASMLERLGDLEAAAKEFTAVAQERVGPSGLATLQRARLEMRRGAFDVAERLLASGAVGKEGGRVEGLLLLVSRRAETKDGDGAARALRRVEAMPRLPEPWRSELPFWRGRVLEAKGDPKGALREYAAILATKPYSAAAQVAGTRIGGLPPKVVGEYRADLLRQGSALLQRGETRSGATHLLQAALLGDLGARSLLATAYRLLPRHAEVLDAPDFPPGALPGLCGDAAACRLLQLGLPQDAEPIVRDARRLDTITGAILAVRLAEDADAGPPALEAAEALDRHIPDDFLLELAPRSVLRALAPRPFDRVVRDASAESGVPRDLLYAVMRQESRFDREAASPAAARGLMQLTLPAAGEAARELNEAPPAYADLYDPARSLRLGARTLKGLLARFSGDPAPVVAAYNAGGGQTSLWCEGSKLPAEALLGSISYTETRTYFRRVLANQLIYRLSASGGDEDPSAAEPPPEPEPVRVRR